MRTAHAGVLSGVAWRYQPFSGYVLVGCWAMRTHDDVPTAGTKRRKQRTNSLPGERDNKMRVGIVRVP